MTSNKYRGECLLPALVRLHLCIFEIIASHLFYSYLFLDIPEALDQSLHHNALSHPFLHHHILLPLNRNLRLYPRSRHTMIDNYNIICVKHMVNYHIQLNFFGDRIIQYLIPDARHSSMAYFI